MARVTLAAEGAKKTTSGLCILTIILKFSLLNSVLSQVRSLSNISHMLLIGIILPANVTVFYSNIFEIIRFDLFEDFLYFGEFLELVFMLEDEPVSERAEQLGYGSHFIVSNLGSVLIFFTLTLLSQLIFLIIVKSGLCAKSNSVSKFAQR